MREETVAIAVPCLLSLFFFLVLHCLLHLMFPHRDRPGLKRWHLDNITEGFLRLYRAPCAGPAPTLPNTRKKSKNAKNGSGPKKGNRSKDGAICIKAPRVPLRALPLPGASWPIVRTPVTRMSGSHPPPPRTPFRIVAKLNESVDVHKKEKRHIVNFRHHTAFPSAKSKEYNKVLPRCAATRDPIFRGLSSVPAGIRETHEVARLVLSFFFFLFSSFLR